MHFKYTFTMALCALFFAGCTSTKPAASTTSENKPSAQREFRAAWIATVANIDWPSKPGLPADQQKSEALALLDFLQSHHFNAAILQVRPQADALYKSDLEPWSYFLTGKQGEPPTPYYDPLAFWVEEAHKRGLELHVWLNPYRAHHRDGDQISDRSVVKLHPDWVVHLKEGYWWMDPARKEVQDQTNAVVMDLVNRYDIDGVHMDDYFYPYPSYNGNVDFPDSLTWSAYVSGGGKLSRGDWRRAAVNDLIERLYKNIKAAKPWVKLGISPFGIWRPGYPVSVEGFDQYNQLYADAKLWLNKGWLDYFSPQLYWPINRYSQGYPVLLGWWSGENTQHRHLWPGISIGRDSSDKNIDEVINEIMVDRGMEPQSQGVVHWNISSLTHDRRMADTLVKSIYRKQALVPASPWLGNRKPASPQMNVSTDSGQTKISWTQGDAASVFHWVVYFRDAKGNRNYQILNRDDRSTILPGTGYTDVRVTAVDRLGNESD